MEVFGDVLAGLDGNDARSIRTIVPHEPERVEEDEKQIMR